MSKPKTRLVMRVNGALRELFHVRELTNGDLLITERAPTNFEEPTGDVGILTKNYSVHRSLGAEVDSFTLTSKMRLADGRLIDTAQMRIVEEERFVALVFCVMPTSMSDERYDFPTRKRDRIVEVSTSDTWPFATMHLTFVSDKGFDPFDLAAGFHVAYSDFKHFRVGTLTGILPFPPMRGGIHLFSTSSPRVNFIHLSGTYSGDLKCQTLEQMRGTIASCLTTFYNMKLAEAEKYADPADPIDAAELEEYRTLGPHLLVPSAKSE